MNENQQHSGSGPIIRHPEELSDQDLRLRCLELAHDETDSPNEVVERASKYLRFLNTREVSDASDTSTERR